LTICLLDPRREMPLEDDWAYALTVEHLVKTGSFELHPWLSANMPFQALWGTAFTLLLGPGFASLRISTLVLSMAGLYAFFRLLRISGLTESEAAAGVLVLWSSPLYLRFSFNFMTDVPFTALVLVSLWLYSLAWTRMGYGMMALAAAAGTAAVLTRQFGVALVPPLVAVAWFRRSDRRMPGLIAVALVPLILAAIYQLSVSVQTPTWAQQVNLRAQRALITDWRLQSVELLWRPGVVLQYLCFFTLPFAIAISVRWLRDPATRSGGRRLYFGIVATLGVSILIALAAHKGVALPSIPWNLQELGGFSRAARRAFTAIVLILAVPYTKTWVARVSADLLVASIDVTAVLFHATMLTLLCLTLVYQQFGDEYLLVYVPWVVWTAARTRTLRFPYAIVWLTALTLLQLMVVTAWVDEILCRNEVQWQAATNTVERLHVAPTRISAAWTWATYYAFDDYLVRHPSSGQLDFRSLFDEWLPAYARQAEYRVIANDGNIRWLPGDLTVARRRTLFGGVLQAMAERVR
jgi:4-amino-4-deoxy-L-arabinose transferase-like glycosyltransferase